MSSSSALRIVHVFRAPLGGLFRHVVDLAVEQAARGHAVGLFFDQAGDGERVRDALARIPGGPRLGVGVAVIPRNPHPRDLSALRAFSRFLKAARPDVVHGHGSKGGLYARLVGAPVRAYTPHGGSFNYAPGSALHRLYMQVERVMARRTDLFLFESDNIRGKYNQYVGVRAGLARVVVNGLSPAEFIPVAAAPDAADILYVGELRAAKGVDTLLDALALVGRQTGAAPSAVLVGSGPDLDALTAQAARLGLAERVRFPGPLPVRRAFEMGRIMVAPSRAESMPYIVLETVAAQVPLLTTDVGGVPEIFGPYRDRLGTPDDPAALARRIVAEMNRPAPERARRARELADYVRARFSVEHMADCVIGAYREALALREPDVRSPRGRRAAAAQFVNEA
ncbi:MAG: glycosyltransferase [Pseudomonadota bacterium]|nr:glycosyltransferase [Pseudomonadota bacterium]